ncbi:MAG: acetyl-CoA carboxylase carboxyltransferase subunit alpha [Chlorobi bacterium]|nr:MAG: acetyl-CoA carboxylase subunit alpha [Chlorobi bacterium OLB7]MBK8909725.1 acetyl-CoA carboxylase carboxyltransferase subunit alpha [Chlorobiota bacterium]MBX7218198.1 acetyl-CoA carboxylase carboxyltransferase subunit alpha [Candidatus Kapabacteria bacterium]
MAKYVLEFEKPILEIEEKIAEMRSMSDQLDIGPEIEVLEQKVEKLRKSVYEQLTRWQRVQLARHPDRPYTLDYIAMICDDFFEMHGDRSFGDDKAIVGGLAQIGGRKVVLIGQQKGRDTNERKVRNFGMPNPEGYRKALRLMKLAERFSLPVVTFIDTPGAYPGIEAEERGQAESIARNLFEMARLQVPIINVVIGEGASGGALGIGMGDTLLMMENTWFSVISPESCSSILWKSWDYKEQAAEALRLTASDLVEMGIADGIIPEPIGGAHRLPKEAADNLKTAILEALDTLAKQSPRQLLRQRRDRYAAMGVFNDGVTA